MVTVQQRQITYLPSNGKKRDSIPKYRNVEFYSARWKNCNNTSSIVKRHDTNTIQRLSTFIIRIDFLCFKSNFENCIYEKLRGQLL